MKINGKDWKTIWITDDLEIKVIDQRVLPHEFKITTMRNLFNFGTKLLINQKR